MAIFRVERTKGYTVMSNCHLRDQNLSLKAKGLLSMMLSLPEDWNFTTKGLAAICKEGTEAIGTGLKELEKAGYIVRRTLRGDHGRITDTEYTIYERPQAEEVSDPKPDTEEPRLDSPRPENPDTVSPDTEVPGPENCPEINKDIQRKDGTITDGPIPSFRQPVQTVEGRKEVSEKRREIMAQIEYDCIADSANREQLGVGSAAVRANYVRPHREGAGRHPGKYHPRAEYPCLSAGGIVQRSGFHRQSLYPAG